MMQIQLTESQNADRERTGACVVPGEPRTDQPRFDGYRPPRQFSDAAAPCQTCGGWTNVLTDRSEIEVDGVTVYCPDCRDGKPIIEIRMPCPTCEGDPDYRFYAHDADLPCEECLGAGHVEARTPCRCACHRLGSPHIAADCKCVDGSVVARATVTLHPVSDSEQLGTVFCRIDGDGGDEVWLVEDYADETMLGRFDPLPVAGRDWVAVFEEIS